ncbi:hypothetical protein FQZ97_1200430 [compost metagenome]
MLGSNLASRQLADNGEGVQLQFAQPALAPLIRPSRTVGALVFSCQRFEGDAARFLYPLSLALRFPFGVTSSHRIGTSGQQLALIGSG